MKLIKVMTESNSYDSEELKFDTIEDLILYLNDNSIISKWNEDNEEVNLRSLNNDNSMYTVSIGLSDYMDSIPNIKVVISIDNKSIESEYFDDYFEAVSWIIKTLDPYR